MASPDWSEYVDLTVFDADARDLFNASIDYGRDLLPEWTPQVGNIEVVLLEAIATQAISVIAAANRVPGAVTESLLALYGIERDAGSRATALVDVTLISDTGYTIPAETGFAYFPVGGSNPVVYKLDEDLNIAAGSTNGTAAVTALAVGTEPNTVPDGSTLQVLATMPYVSSSTLSSRPEGGKEPETGQQFFTRAMTILQSYSGALTTPSQIESWVLVTYPDDVYRCHVYDLRRKTDRDVTSDTFDTHDGYALIVVSAANADIADTSDVPLTIAQLNSISEELDSKTNTGLITELVNAELVDIDIDVEVTILNGYTSTQVEYAIGEALKAYLSPNRWAWGDTIRVNEIVSLLDQIDGVDYVTNLNGITTTSPGVTTEANGDVTFNILGTLPVSGTHTISATTS